MKGSLRGLAVVWAWLLWASLAAADVPRVRLTWQRPADSMCPSGAALQSDVEALTGYTIFTGGPDADVLVHGEIEDLPTGVHARIEARTADDVSIGVRELSGSPGTCASLRRALALVLTMLLDPDEVAGLARESTGTRIAVGGSAAGLAGTLPRVTPGVGLALALEVRPRLRLRSDAAYWLPVAIETVRGTGAQFQAFSAGLAACPWLLGGAGSRGLWLCAGAQVGGLLAAPRALAGPAHQTRLLAQGFLELGFSLPLPRQSALELGLGPVLSFLRPRFFLIRGDGSTLDVHRPALVGAILRLTLIIAAP